MSGIVDEKHPLGSNILPFSEVTKLDRDIKHATKLQPRQRFHLEVQCALGGNRGKQTG